MTQQKSSSWFLAAGTAAVALGLAGGVILPVAHAQSVTLAAPPLPGAYKAVPALRLDKVPAYEVASRLSRTTGATVLVSGNIATTPVSLTSIGGSLDAVLTQFANLLPKGTVIRAAFVPAPANGATPAGDAVAEYLNATAALQAPPPPNIAKYAAASAAPPRVATELTMPFMAGQWEVLGKQIALDKAIATTNDLGLRPVYLVVLPRPKADVVATMGQMQTESMRLMLSMTPEQKQAVFSNQMNALLNMPSADRQAMLGQFMGQGANMMKSMMALPPEQRDALFADMRAAAQAAGLPMGPGGGGGGNAGGGPGR